MDVGDRLRPIDAMGLAGLQRHRQRCGAFRLDPEHLSAGHESFHRGPDPRDEPSSTHRDEDGPDLREFLDDLQADRPLSGDRGRMRERVNEHGGPRFPGLFLMSLNEVHAGDGRHVRSLRADRLDLSAHSPFRDSDGTGNSEATGGPGDRETVIAGADRASAPLTFRSGEARDSVPHAADLERPESLQVLEFQPNRIVCSGERDRRRVPGNLPDNGQR